VCNGIDDNCDGVLDPENTPGCRNYYYDGDGDSYGVGAPRCYCGPTGSYRSTNALDCDDANAARNPGVPENCATGIDDNCNGVANEQNALNCTTFHRDNDRDTWGTSETQCWCSAVGDFQATRPGDCNDASAAINPGAAETCNNVDDNCNGSTDEGFACRIGAVEGCTVAVPTKTCNGSRTCSSACAWGSCVVPETGANIETCNNIDDDCDGTVDDPPSPPNVLCAPRTNATMGCSAGICVIASCTAGWADANGVVTDGCECQIESPEAGELCGTARNLGTFPDTGSDVTVTGKITSGSDVDCYSFTATDSADTTCDNFNVDIRFTANPGSQFQFTAYRASCATVVCANEVSSYNWYTDFTTGSMEAKRGECPCRTTNLLDFNRCADNSSSFYFCVSRRAGFSPTCDQYSIRVTNGVF
ncbi:MAG: putative metal-binding motif-containing protein, partial [Myxococcota bacterium]|nr:putative metal-binding motif-containing protein [Myxococcota bacterium]